MALVIVTIRPQELLSAIKKAIDDKEIETWEYDSDGDFTHSPPQWRNKAWLRPSISAGELRFGILGQTNVNLSKVVYGVYHGRFTEMLLTHFDDKFSRASATAKLTAPDRAT